VNDGGVRGKDRTGLGGVIADGHDVVERLGAQFVDPRRSMTRNVDARFAHHGHGPAIQAAGLDPGRADLDPLPLELTRPALGHLAAA